MPRKKYYDTNSTKENKQSDQWQVGLYIRISREDEGAKTESDSVVNQRLLLLDFLKSDLDLLLKEIYIDDGHTGTSLNRPGFNRMITAVKTNHINCIIVKDLSRFGRNYSEVGKYLESVLPSLGCRFISVIDNLDSDKRPDEITSVFVQFKHIMNEHYSRENSIKIRATWDAMRREGKFVSSFVPYGYLKSLHDKHKLVPDPEAVTIVNMIFDWCIEGMGVIKIAQKLNGLGILCPSDYKTKKGHAKACPSNCTYLWQPNVVRQILKNKVYIGTLAQKKETTLNHKNRKRIHIPEDQWIVVHGTHEPVIDQEKFNIVQSVFNRCTRSSPNRDKVYLFSGLIRCADCNRAMIRNPKHTAKRSYVYYKCRTYNQISRDQCPHSHSINHEDLIEIVFSAIKIQIDTIANLDNVLKQINEDNGIKIKRQDFVKQIAHKKRQIANKSKLKAGLYEDWRLENITREEYVCLKEHYTDDIKNFEKSILLLGDEIALIDKIQIKDIRWITSFLAYFSTTNLTRQMLISLIDTIYIRRDKSVKVVFRYQDEFAKIRKHLKTELNKEDKLYAI